MICLEGTVVNSGMSIYILRITRIYANSPLNPMLFCDWTEGTHYFILATMSQKIISTVSDLKNDSRDGNSDAPAELRKCSRISCKALENCR